MSLDEIETPIVLGYIGDRLTFEDDESGPLPGSDRYLVHKLNENALDTAAGDFDGFLVDTGRLDGSGPGVHAALDTDRPIITVGDDDVVTVSPDVLPAVDAHLSLSSGTVDSLDALDAVFDDRLSNLDMPASDLIDAIFESVPAHLYLKDRSARHVRVSSYYQRPADLIGKTDHDIYEESFAAQTVEQDLAVMENAEPLLDEEELNPGDGDWSLTSKVPVYDGEDVVGLLGLTRNITKRKEYELRLERQKERLEEFASVISHDLRNPLTVAQGRVDLARENYPDDEHLRVAVDHLQRMDELIDEVLTMTRQGRDVEEVAPVALRTIVKQCWESVATGDATVTVTGEYRFLADHSRLRHVFENLFRNAVEHGPASAPDDSPEHGGQPVSVTVSPLDDGRGFYVEDDGRGIPAEDRDSVFDRGYTTSDDGTGLGLKIVRQVVESHGWSITVLESAEGGARFEIHGVEPAPDW